MPSGPQTQGAGRKFLPVTPHLWDLQDVPSSLGVLRVYFLVHKNRIPSTYLSGDSTEGQVLVLRRWGWGGAVPGLAEPLGQGEWAL